jgi:hypothetical protein
MGLAGDAAAASSDNKIKDSSRPPWCRGPASRSQSSHLELFAWKQSDHRQNCVIGELE